MRILIDIGHPAHVHLFKNFTIEMQKQGHIALFTCREKEFEIELLEANGFKYVSFGKKYKSIAGKIFGLLVFDLKMLKTAIKFKPDIFLSVGSMYAAQVAFMLRKPHFTFEDTGNLEQIRLYLPFTKMVFTPDVLKRDLGEKQLRYPSYHELAYLSPNYFSPDNSIYKFLGIESKDSYVIIRFVSWNATHDVGQNGINDKDKNDIISFLATKYKVFISSESELPEELKKYKIKIPPEHIHHALYYADLVISEGATMASEAGVLGTTAIYVNSIEACNNRDQEKYELVYNFKSGLGVLDKVKEIVKENMGKEELNNRKEIMLSNKIDVTDFLLWFVKNYPESYLELKKNPKYQFNFKINNGLHSKNI
ncbi:DUF354 domain-containing protein [Aureibaculum sp. A20]|uniref:DUF354 domain-containing protein n=1 Tax=Aureibaculum flavum TaxID=2795986 RepID=A0ABS0WKY1_9FLAO|nr:DUF354 domain-containing protein [Aureibaculum flavum]MBJ2172608.1 DUF354 domain-containing protein [Aureibaculum flavum]